MLDIIGKRNYFFALSIILILAGVVAAFVNGVKLDIQFQGGTIIQMQVNDSNVDTQKAQDVVKKAIGKETNAQHSQTIDAENAGKKIDLLVLNIGSEDTLTGDEVNKVVEAIRSEFNVKADSEVSVNSVAPFIGKEIMENGLKAVIWASILIILYIWWRFSTISGLSAGVMALVALLHDAAMATAAYIIFQIPLNELYIATILTILGYSINDTIVIYDRIRENTKLFKKMPIGELVNKSINQSLTRSINTSVAIFISIATVYVFAAINNIGTMRDFALPMMIGTISGCYSTIFIAGPLWVMWKEHQAKKKIAAKHAE